MYNNGNTSLYTICNFLLIFPFTFVSITHSIFIRPAKIIIFEFPNSEVKSEFEIRLNDKVFFSPLANINYFKAYKMHFTHITLRRRTVIVGLGIGVGVAVVSYFWLKR